MLSFLISFLSTHLKMEAHAPAGRILSTGIFVLLLTYYLFRRLTRNTSFSKGLKIAIAAFIFVSTFTFPVIFFILMRSSETMVPSVIVYATTSFLLGFIVYLLFVVFFSDLFLVLFKVLKAIRLGVALVLKRTLQKRDVSGLSKIKFKTYKSICIFGLAFLLFIIGYVQALNQPDLEIRNVDIGKGESFTKSIRIAHLSDLHINPLLDGEWLEKIIEKVRSAEPDLVVITGDFADGKARDNKKYLKLFKVFKAPLYFISGNHEILWGKDDWISAFRNEGITVLDDRRTSIEIKGIKILLAGIGDSGRGPWRFRIPARFHTLLDGAPESDLRILLSHRPEILPAAAEAGFDLVLAGHTHNGQTFPLNLFAGLITPYPKGFYKKGNTVLFTSPGAGYVGPPVRLFVPKEVTILNVNIPK
jgi:predicted MPP superfamily phosphohydrolase